MTEKELETFKEYCYTYAERFVLTVCADTGKGWLPKMCQYKWWRIIDDFEFKYNIEVKENDIKCYKVYEDIMLEVLNKRIEECKVEVTKREKENKKRKSKKD